MNMELLMKALTSEDAETKSADILGENIEQFKKLFTEAFTEGRVDFDTTQNLLLEGDNLEVLKLLQKSYAGKIKLIYIDPPYNTGKDFVYADNFQDNIKNYLMLTDQIDSD